MYKEGDWRCPNKDCWNNNFAKRNVCNRCNTKRPENYIEVSSNINFKLGGPPGLFKVGDWKCSKCDNINFSWRKVCNRCDNKVINEKCISRSRSRSRKRRSRSRSRSEGHFRSRDFDRSKCRKGESNRYNGRDKDKHYQKNRSKAFHLNSSSSRSFSNSRKTINKDKIKNNYEQIQTPIELKENYSFFNLNQSRTHHENIDIMYNNSSHLNKAKDNIIANIPFNLVPHLRETLLNDKQIDESPKKQCEN